MYVCVGWACHGKTRGLYSGQFAKQDGEKLKASELHSLLAGGTTSAANRGVADWFWLVAGILKAPRMAMLMIPKPSLVDFIKVMTSSHTYWWHNCMW